uniref:Uncharacterized protein n=1 Tax=Plectus sambesii TaxID=2011161 RepID=A0A914XQZ1_9BILA
MRVGRPRRKHAVWATKLVGVESYQRTGAVDTPSDRGGVAKSQRYGRPGVSLQESNAEHSVKGAADEKGM